MRQITRILDVILESVLIVLMVALVCSVSWQVISRYMFAAPSSWTEEIARFLMIWVGLLGAAYAFRNNVHLGLDLLPKRLTGRPALVLNRFNMLMVLIFSAAVLITGGAGLVALTWELRQHSAVLGLPIAYVYSVIPLTGILICLYGLEALLHKTTALAETTGDTGV